MKARLTRPQSADTAHSALAGQLPHATAVPKEPERWLHYAVISGFIARRSTPYRAGHSARTPHVGHSILRCIDNIFDRARNHTGCPVHGLVTFVDCCVLEIPPIVSGSAIWTHPGLLLRITHCEDNPRAREVPDQRLVAAFRAPWNN